MRNVLLPTVIRSHVPGPHRSGEIAAAMGVNPSTGSRQVANLVRSGLVERRADPGDGRASLLAVAIAGHRARDAERRRGAARITEALAGWTPESRDRFAEMLGCFASDLQRTHDGDAQRG
ncbi:MarR family winged helix-turn-helix transcriptional regulator [Prauserella endophytica]|uniref:MarR family winged helix-turn-helix transcriptional regulator n=1 Tax=Prauserella endophytica TaxID=1592324 RepID=UPI001E4D0B94|nr:MarR family winged helix-turn-helix transcriptional regulator [Prauserella endophytica]